MEQKHLTDQLFTDFSLPVKLAAGIADLGFDRCTPIQAETLPILLAGTDVAAQAPTGTGKTAAFLVGMFNHLIAREGSGPAPRALILAPTRELAVQIHRDAAGIGAHTGLRIALAYGGTGYQEQRAQIAAGCDVLIGTPGRLIDYFKQQVFRLDGIECVVIDEADRMFDLGFIRDVRFLLRRMPATGRRLNMLFSATLSYAVLELAYEHMNDPAVIKLAADKLIVDGVTEQVYFPGVEEKPSLLIGLLRGIDPTRTLVFVNTRNGAVKVHDWLAANGFSAGVMSGDVPQQRRERLLREFTDGTLQVLVATDVAARGLHIPHVSHVINFDLPYDAEDYVHRIGRTARAGASGDAISFACETYAYSLPVIESYIGHELSRMEVSDDLLAADLVAPHPARPVRRRRESPATARTSRRHKAPASDKSSRRPTRSRTDKDNPAVRTSKTPAPEAAANSARDVRAESSASIPGVEPRRIRRARCEVPAIG